MPRIEIVNLTKVYTLELAEGAWTIVSDILGRRTGPSRSRTKTAVDDVSLSIFSGERVGIIGPNGAGKSTLLHMIAGIGSPTTGAVSVDGKVTSILTLGVGLREDMTGRENIYLDGELQGKTRPQVDEVLDLVIEFADLGEFIDRPVRTYSTGMKSRLAFAMISHIDPEILLVDEALSVGDAAFSVKATSRIREICARGKIVVVVSHGLAAINEICNRCLWMEGGRIVMDGRPEEVTSAYAAAVRDYDEIELVRRFRSLVGVEQLMEGYCIHTLELREPGGRLRKLPIHVDQEFALRIGATVGSAVGALTLRLLVERLDGLLLVDEAIALEFPSNPVDILFPQILAPGVYKLGVELKISDAVAAQRSLVIEVVSENRPAGGRPALYYPYTISITPLPDAV